MGATKFQIKVFAHEAAAVDPGVFVPVFHEWIKQGSFSELLIDVVDYTHVHHGPAVLLVGHESDYCIDFGEGAPGLRYSRKRGGSADAADALLDALRRVLGACKKLEDDPALGRVLAFSGERLEIRVNDRIRAPNDAATFQELTPSILTVLKKLFGETPFSATRAENDPRDLLTVVVNAPGAPPARELGARIG